MDNEARTSSSLVKTLPQPVTPSSVTTAISVWTQSSGCNSLDHPPSGVRPRNPNASISLIFIYSLPVAAKDPRFRCKCHISIQWENGPGAASVSEALEVGASGPRRVYIDQ